MTADEIYQIALAAGFPPGTAVKMTAIALKESGGNPTALNIRPPDESYGLWQINMRGDLGAARLKQYGLAAKTELYDPAVNARVARDLWSGSDLNLDRHWAIVRSAVDRTRYERFLPVAQAAAERVELAQAGSPPAAGGGGGPIRPPVGKRPPAGTKG